MKELCGLAFAFLHKNLNTESNKKNLNFLEKINQSSHFFFFICIETALLNYLQIFKIFIS